MLVRIYVDASKVKDLPHGLDIASSKIGKWIDVVTDEEELNAIRGKGFITEILLDDVNAYHRKMQAQYHYYQEFVDSLTNIAVQHPEIAKLDTIGTSYEGREILCLKISDNVNMDEDEPELLFMGLHHAREWPTLEICLFYADTLTRAYGTDSQITEIVNSREIWIVPCINPDGYVYCHDQGIDWRKNRRPVPGGIGIDLNRNYDGSCNGDPWGEWGSITGWATSHNPSTSTYCGPCPFSESETQAIRDLVLSHNFVFTVSYHTYGEEILWPWGYIFDLAPDADILSELGERMASEITRQSGYGTYDPHQSVGLYPTTGDTDDWVYGYDLYVAGKNTLPYTVETCNQFHPPASELAQVIRENFDGALYLCEVVGTVATIMIPRVMPPSIKIIDYDSTGNYTICWSQKNPASNPNHYQLDELMNLSIVTDDADSLNPCWNFNGFDTSSARYHSPNHSYYSVTQSANDVISMTTSWPVPISLGDSLTFWCWYNIKARSDYAYVEVSTDSREWQILGSFNGSSGWVRKAYTLEDYVGGSIFIKFRYVTNGGYPGEGFYVDDIYPIGCFDSIFILSASIEDTFYTIACKPSGVYYYRVRGYNSQGWGDFSQLKDMVVENPSYTIFGKVGLSNNPTDSSGSVVTVEGTSYFDSTDVHGVYQLDIPSCTYDIIASHEGYISDTLLIVSIVSDTTFNFTLTKIIHDVGVDSIIQPPDTVFADSLYSPTVAVANYGNIEEEFKVICYIDTSIFKSKNLSIYAESTEITLSPEAESIITFPAWQAPQWFDTLYISVYTELPADEDSSNNWKSKMLINQKVGIDELSQNVPSSLILSQITPNPALQRVDVKYTLPEDSKVRLEIYDITGSSIAILVNELQKAGYHRVLWNGTDLSGKKVPSGVYFCLLKAKDGTRKTKFVYLR